VVKEDSARYASYVGEYRLEAPQLVIDQTGPIFTVSAVGERLFGQGKDQKAELTPRGGSVFQAEGFPIRLTFVSEPDGRVNEVRLSFMGIREFVARRVR
jgi:hypothetical protein